MDTSPGVSPPEGDNCATETCGVPTEDAPDRSDVELPGVTQSSVPKPSTSMSWFHPSADATE